MFRDLIDIESVHSKGVVSLISEQKRYLENIKNESWCFRLSSQPALAKQQIL